MQQDRPGLLVGRVHRLHSGCGGVALLRVGARCAGRRRGSRAVVRRRGRGRARRGRRSRAGGRRRGDARRAFGLRGVGGRGGLTVAHD
ncbi:hypothetical protein FJ656_03765 [Schumannella luteola]|nr:hypothetical protein FJ656_03765 [Schumannella luteola]